MKRLLLTIFLGLSLLGCKTADNRPSVERYIPIVRSVARTGAMVTIQKDPESARYFKLALEVLNTAIANKTYDGAKLRAALKAAGTDDTAYMAVAAALDLYETAFKDVVNQKLDSNTYALEFLSALRDGLADALVE